MCGIAGLLSAGGSQAQIEILIGRMQSVLRHRGSDDQGIYISSAQNAAIAHTRLSILDLSPDGHQPMSTADGHRPKRGFTFPFEQWMAGEWRDYFPDVDCNKNIPLKPWYRRWSLGILQHWWEGISA